MLEYWKEIEEAFKGLLPAFIIMGILGGGIVYVVGLAGRITETKAAVEANKIAIDGLRVVVERNHELLIEINNRLIRLEEHAKQIDKNTAAIDKNTTEMNDLKNKVHLMDKEVDRIKTKVSM